MRIAVVGAGIGGLCAAIGLQSAGADVVVLERAASLAPVGSGLSVFANGVTALDALGIGDGFRTIASDEMSGLRGGQRTPDGTWLATIPPHVLTGLRVVHRADLHRVLVDSLRPQTLVLGAAVRAVDPTTGSVSLHREGTVVDEAFDLVVAADGIRSAVRRSWPGDPGLRYSGYSAWRGVTAHPVDLRGAAGETWGRGLRFGVAPLPGGRVYWFAVATMPRDARIPDEFAEVGRLFSGWHEPISELIDATDPSDVLRHPIDDLAAPLATFRRGRCVLLGDAAHAMTPDLGQGGAQAMEDAATLTALVAPLADGEVSPSALDSALGAYDSLRRRRTQSIARRSRAVGRVAHVQSRIGVGIRDMTLRFTPPSALARQIASIQTWTPPHPADPDSHSSRSQPKRSTS